MERNPIFLHWFGEKVILFVVLLITQTPSALLFNDFLCFHCISLQSIFSSQISSVYSPTNLIKSIVNTHRMKYIKFNYILNYSSLNNRKANTEFCLRWRCLGLRVHIQLEHNSKHLIRISSNSNITLNYSDIA